MVPTVPARPPAGHRRMSSLRSTTLNFFKGNTKGSQLQHSSSLRRNELTISSPLPITEENVSPTTIGPPSRAATDPMLSEKRHHLPSSAGFFEVGFGRGLIPASEKASSIGDDDGDDNDNESTITAGVESRQMSPSRQSEFERKAAATQPARSKKRGAKLKMALSLLRRRSNTNLRRAYGDPVDETCETSRDRETFFEPLLDPDYVESSAASPVPTRRAATPTGLPVTPQKPNGFKFTLSPRSHHQSRQVLAKAQPPPPPPPDNRRHRRATVASVIFDPSGIDPDHPRNSVWSGRPTSSQSVILNGVPQIEEGPVGPEGAMVNGASGQGGLFPRPSSLQRHWSDGARNAGAVSNIDRSQLTFPGSDQDRVRPLSFGAMLNGYGSMKITEAVTLETRVQELESQVAMLQGFITQHIEFPQVRRTFSTGAPTTRGLGEDRDRDRDRDRDTLRPPPDDRMKRSFSLSSAGSSEKVESPEIPSTPRNLGPPPPRPVDQRLMVYNQHTEQKREETLQALEGFKMNTESKRDTASTIKGPAMMHDCDMGARSPSPTPGVSMAQYTGLVSQIRREQRSRRKLEAQIANLQEQMSLVLHRQLLQSSASPTITDSMGLRTDFSSIRRKTSSEVPTPDLTPPRVSPIDMIPVNLFMGFDSDNRGSDNDSIFMGVDTDDNEVWETPAEERESIVSDSDSERGFRETLSSFPSPQPRTMSLSQLTHKSSLATR